MRFGQILMKRFTPLAKLIKLLPTDCDQKNGKIAEGCWRLQGSESC